MVQVQQFFGYKALSPFWDEIPADRIKTFPIDGSIELGGQSWEVVYTPGHCINQTVFYQRESKQLLSADMLLKMVPTAIIDADLKPPYTRVKSLVQLRASYKKLQDYDIQYVYPGHYESFEDGQAMIEKHLNRIQMRTDSVYQHIQNGVHDFMELFKLTYPGRMHPVTFFMVIGYLDILLDEGKISKEEVDGMWHYSTVKHYKTTVK